jgi:sialic acid synthase SpsE
VILSTGASYLEEVRRAVEVISGAGCSEIALLHCASLYPPKYEDVNLSAMVTLKEAFGCPVGLSDHTPGSAMPIGAVALGASIIEKHITLDKGSKGPDHAYAMEVEEFKSMVIDIRNLEAALGDGVKRPAASEMGERVGARRSVYTKVAIGKGSVISADMLKLVRHAHGIEPGDLGIVVGSTAARDINKDMPVKKEDLCL